MFFLRSQYRANRRVNIRLITLLQMDSLHCQNYEKVFFTGTFKYDVTALCLFYSLLHINSANPQLVTKKCYLQGLAVFFSNLRTLRLRIGNTVTLNQKHIVTFFRGLCSVDPLLHVVRVGGFGFLSSVQEEPEACSNVPKQFCVYKTM